MATTPDPIAEQLVRQSRRLSEARSIIESGSSGGVRLWELPLSWLSGVVVAGALYLGGNEFVVSLAAGVAVMGAALAQVAFHELRHLRRRIDAILLVLSNDEA